MCLRPEPAEASWPPGRTTAGVGHGHPPLRPAKSGGPAEQKTVQGRWAPGRGSGTAPLFRVCLPPGGFAGLGGACMQSTAARPHGQTGRLVRAPRTARVPQTGHPTAASPPGGSTWPNGRACNSGLDPGPQPEGCLLLARPLHPPEATCQSLLAVHRRRRPKAASHRCFTVVLRTEGAPQGGGAPGSGEPPSPRSA